MADVVVGLLVVEIVGVLSEREAEDGKVICCTCMHTHTSTHMHAYTFIHTHACIHIHPHTYIHVVNCRVPNSHARLDIHTHMQDTHMTDQTYTHT